MSGSNPAFDPQAFKDAIHLAMQMGAPNLISEQVTFKWTPQKTYAVEDVADRPYDWTDSPTQTVTHPDVIVPVAVTWGHGPSTATDIAQFDASLATLTLLDEDYALVSSADVVLIGGNTYDVKLVAPPLGLFDVTVYQVEVVARDES